MSLSSSRKRFTSQSSLNSDHSASSRQHQYPATHSCHSPRNKIENTVHLTSPGPLEGMLKTATETGDIGIFSIRPSPTPSAATSDQASRQRKYDLDRNVQYVPSSGGQQHHKHGDDRKYLPSYRNNSFDAMSMYKSESQPIFHFGSPTPPAGAEQRSYSLSAWTSRHIPSYRSSSTLPNYPTKRSSVQSSRSPFPYPTRLKRPGVRPCSPALTNSGKVDYSRMVEIDRISHRTAYEYFAPNHFHLHHNPLSRSFRSPYYQANCLSHSYTSPAPPKAGHRLGKRGYHRPNLQWEKRPTHFGDRSVTDSSTRSSSLASLVDMYHWPASGQQYSQSLRSKSSFYYDYSEAFDVPAPLPVSGTPVAPTASTPQYAASAPKPPLPRDDNYQEDSDIFSQDKAQHIPRAEDAAYDPQPQLELGSIYTVSRYETPPLAPEKLRGTAAGATHKQHPNAGVGLSNSDENLGESFDQTHLLSKGPYYGCGATCDQQFSSASKFEPTLLGEVIAGDSPSSPRDHVPFGTNKREDEFYTVPQARNPTGERRNSVCIKHSLSGPSLQRDSMSLGFAGLVSSFDKTTTKFQEAPQPCDSRHTRLREVVSANVGDEKDLSTDERPAAFGKGYLPNPQSNQLVRDMCEEELASEILKTQILSPSPISPAHQVRVKNSISKLMKGLPLVPGEMSPLDSASSAAEETNEVSPPAIRLSNLSTSPPDSRITYYSDIVERKPGTETITDLSSKLKFRIRQAPTFSGDPSLRPSITSAALANHWLGKSGEMPPASDDSQEISKQTTRSVIRLRKLRNDSLEDSDAASGTVRRHIGVTNKAAITQGEDTQGEDMTVDLFTPPRLPERKYERRGRRFTLTSSYMENEPPAASPLSEPQRKAPPIPRQCVIEEETPWRSSSTVSHREEADVKASHRATGLRKKVSNIRMRVTKPGLYLRGRSKVGDAQRSTAGLEIAQIHCIDEEDLDGAGFRSSPIEGALGASSMRLGSRVKSWIAEKRKKMYTYVGRTRASGQG